MASLTIDQEPLILDRVALDLDLYAKHAGAVSGRQDVLAVDTTSWGSTGTSIGVPVPSGATTGNVVVTVAGAASNGVTFTVLTPTISSLSPTSGPVTTAVTITGTNFGSTQGSSTVKFNGTTATPTSWGSTGTSIGVPVPSGATTGNVVVTVAGAASNGVSFTVTSPTITSLTPTSGLPNAPVTIAGSSFGTSGTVTFNGTAAGVNTWSATSISVNVPSAATTGNVVVTVGGVASSGVSFAVQCPNVGAGVYYYFSDALGSSRVVTDSSGAVCNDSDYYPYGGERPIISSTNNHYKFTGKERDSESGLDNFGARYNSSQYGRFISPDPKMPSIRHLVNPQKWNKYAYVLNNPLSLFDPDGQEEITIVLRAFIPQKSVGGFKGDNRTFSSSPSGPDVTSRTTITISVETDPSKSGGNPMIGQPSYSVSPSTLTTSVGSWTKQGDGPQTATATYDANGNTVIKLNQDVSNPFVKYVPGQGIRSDLTTTIDPAGTNITTTGTVSGSPSFEENATVSNGTTTNVPLSTSSGNPAAFVGNLFRDKPVQKESCIKDKDNDTCR